MRLSKWIDLFLESKPVGIFLERETIESCAVTAVRQFNAYGYFDYQKVFDSLSDDHSFKIEIDINYCIIDDEWAIIRPLFDLYVERENAIYLEASRGVGIDVFGRTVSEVNADIAAEEAELPNLAFDEPIVTV